MDQDGLMYHLRQSIEDERVIEAMKLVPRELFIPPENRHLAYEDMPLLIGWGQTISQPFMVALMTEALELTGTERVLEIGTGSGYQTAILAQLAQQVISLERNAKLKELAISKLNRLGYSNIEVFSAERTLGRAQSAPYDAIIVTAGAPHIPQVLVDQLAEGGRMVIPVGSRDEQELLRITLRNGQLITKRYGGCRFVPLIGEGAWDIADS